MVQANSFDMTVPTVKGLRTGGCEIVDLMWSMRSDCHSDTSKCESHSPFNAKIPADLCS